MSKEIMLPEWIRDEAIVLADAHCTQEGLKAPKGFDPNKLMTVGVTTKAESADPYVKKFMGYVYNFCKEAYLHSLTPSGELRSNPGTPQMSSDIYPTFGEFYAPSTGFFAKYGADLPKPRLDVRLRTFKAALMHLTMTLLTLKGKMSKNDFMYPKDAKADDLRRIEIARYKRIMVNSIMHSAMTAVMKLSVDGLDAYLKQAKIQVKGKDRNFVVALATSPIADLHQDSTRQAFAKMVYDQMVEEFKKVDVDKAIGKV